MGEWDNSLVQASRKRRSTVLHFTELPLPLTDLETVLEATAPLWEEMRHRRIFISGGTGFFGRWLLESFAHANRCLSLFATATVLSRDPKAFLRRVPHIATDPAFEFVTGDICNFQFLEGEYAFVVHAATEVAQVTGSADPLGRLRSIEQGTERMLRFASAHGTRKFLLVSSGAAYGQQPTGMSHIPEDYLGAPSPLDLDASYGEGKRLSEHMCALYAAKGSTEFKIARCFAFIGPGLPLDAHFAIGNFVADALGGQAIRVAGNGTATRSYLYASDLAIWLWTLLFRAPTLQIFNVGSEQAVSIADLAHIVAETVGSAGTVSIATQPQEGILPRQYVPSTEKARRLLQLKQTVPLDESIRRTIAWHTALR